MLQPQIDQFREALLKDSQSHDLLCATDDDFDRWVVEGASVEGYTNFANLLDTRFGKGEWRYASHTGESDKSLMPFFLDIQNLIDDIESGYTLLEAPCPSAHDIAEIYDFQDYIVELSDGGLAVYFK